MTFFHRNSVLIVYKYIFLVGGKYRYYHVHNFEDREVRYGLDYQPRFLFNMPRFSGEKISVGFSSNRFQVVVTERSETP